MDVPVSSVVEDEILPPVPSDTTATTTVAPTAVEQGEEAVGGRGDALHGATSPKETVSRPVGLDELLAMDAELEQHSPRGERTAGAGRELKAGRSTNTLPPSEGSAASLLPEKEAATRDKTVHYSMDSLFGPYFEIKVLDDNIEELAKAPFPALMDVQNIISSQFGNYVRAEDIQQVWWSQDDANILAKLMQENKEECDSAELERLFGKAGMMCLLKERKMEPFRLLDCVAPATPPFAGGYHPDNMWLVDMPKIQPNRQILHADPQPYAPERSGYLESNDRMLYTPHNVIRWAYHKGQNTFMSNARLVRWSDGSVTLQVGEDTFSLHDNKSNSALHVLGAETKVKKGNVEIPCVLKTLQPSRHFVVEGSSAKSIAKETINEAVLHETVRQKRRLPYLTSQTPDVDLRKPAKDRTLYEECVHAELERKRKMLDQRIKEGNPPTLEEQVAMDNEMWNRINAMTQDDMVRHQEEARRHEEVRVAERQAYQRSTRRERDLELEGGDYSDADEHDFSRKRAREDDPVDRLDPLRDVLETVADELPADSEVAKVVAGFIGYMNGTSYSEPTIENELPDIIKSIQEGAPGVDVAPLQDIHQRLFRR
ncbi:hypothetical protein STCU_07960 [Strigomonas culicis]|uniref:RNA polymerase-associated protein LEO1 n=1 Tax=Strigomonas culicis TaxID=28005 RepID=S9U2F9_9TRYP|nr:hypothetical protein STCU_07960 [Strigomonas culicis]|eukprot:EPY22999.1 hypothetical protein STCU_07960 [Strigomonas culicis]